MINAVFAILLLISTKIDSLKKDSIDSMAKQGQTAGLVDSMSRGSSSFILNGSTKILPSDSYFFVQDYPTVRVIPVENEKEIKDQFWYPWIGSIIGALIGFFSAVIVMGFNNRRDKRLRHQDHEKELLKELYNAQTDLTPIFVNLRDLARELFFHNFNYNYNYCKAYQLEEDELDQFDELIKSKEEHVSKFESKREKYKTLVAESTRYFMRFQNLMVDERRTEFRNLINKLLNLNFYTYDYFNPTGEDAEQEHHSIFYPLKNEIFNKNIKENFDAEITEPIRHMIMVEIRTVLDKIDALDKNKNLNLFFFKIPIN